MTGILYGVGVGPGDPELLTLKAHALITTAKVVAYPAPDSGESFARSIVSSFISEDAIECPIIIPMCEERFPAREVYDSAAKSLARHLDNGRNVVVLCEGDPFFYGSFMYLFERFADNYQTSVIPGVSSLTACAAQFGRPLAGRNDTLMVIPATLPEEKLRSRLEGVESAAIIKVGRNFGKVKLILDSMGLLENSGYVERATLPNQVIGNLIDLNLEEAPYFSMILVYNGDVL